MEEMAEPRMARSAKIAELNLDTARTPEQPSVSMAGTVDKIISSFRPGAYSEMIYLDDHSAAAILTARSRLSRDSATASR
jgi:hypothetical protein